MDELERFRANLLNAWELLAQQPSLAIAPLGCALPALMLLLVPDSWIPEFPPNLIPLLFLIFLTQVQIRTAFSRCILAALRAEPWSAAQALREGLLQPTAGTIILGALDGALTLVALGALLWFPMGIGVVPASAWWCLSALIACGLAEGNSERIAERATDNAAGSVAAFALARDQALAIFQAGQIELVVAAVAASGYLHLLYNTLVHLPLSPSKLFSLFYLLGLIPARELFLQLYITVAFDASELEA